MAAWPPGTVTATKEPALPAARAPPARGHRGWQLSRHVPREPEAAERSQYADRDSDSPASWRRAQTPDENRIGDGGRTVRALTAA